MKCVSARNSGVKYLESHTRSLVRAVPFSQVQSAYANGCEGSGLGEPARLVCGFEESTSTMLEEEGATSCDVLSVAFKLPGKAGDVTEEASGKFPLFDSSSATLFSSCSTRSRSQRSRSVNAAGGAAVLSRASFANVSALPSSSANRRFGNKLMEKNILRIVAVSSRFVLNKIFSSLKPFFSTGVILRFFRMRPVHRSCTGGYSRPTFVWQPWLVLIWCWVDRLFLRHAGARPPWTLRGYRGRKRFPDVLVRSWTSASHLAPTERARRARNRKRRSRLQIGS